MNPGVLHDACGEVMTGVLDGSVEVNVGYSGRVDEFAATCTVLVVSLAIVG